MIKMKNNELKDDNKLKDGMLVLPDSIVWLKNGILHREDGPAIEHKRGEKNWYFNGKLHREDGPATEYSDGSYEYWLNGILHREDGPAIFYINEETEWWINGIQYSENEFNKILEKKKLNEKLEKNLKEKPVSKKKKI